MGQILLEPKGNLQRLVKRWTIKKLSNFWKILVLTTSLCIETLLQQVIWGGVWKRQIRTHRTKYSDLIIDDTWKELKWWIFKNTVCWKWSNDKMVKLKVDRMNKYSSDQLNKLFCWKSLKLDSPTVSVKTKIHCLEGRQLIEPLWWRDLIKTIRWNATCLRKLLFWLLNFTFVFQMYYFVILTFFFTYEIFKSPINYLINCTF